MKRIFTLSTLFFLSLVLLSSCAKDRIAPANNESYWLNQDEGDVVYSDPSCSYWVLATYSGYTIVRSSSGSQPYEGELIYGNFNSRGTRDMYNYSGRFVFTATVTDYWLTYGQALDALDYYCPLYGKGVQARAFKESAKVQKK